MFGLLKAKLTGFVNRLVGREEKKEGAIAQEAPPPAQAIRGQIEEKKEEYFAQERIAPIPREKEKIAAEKKPDLFAQEKLQPILQEKEKIIAKEKQKESFSPILQEEPKPPMQQAPEIILQKE